MDTWQEFERKSQELKTQQMTLDEKALEYEQQYYTEQAKLENFDSDQSIHNNEQVAAIALRMEQLDGKASAMREASLQIWERIEQLKADMGYDGD